MSHIYESYVMSHILWVICYESYFMSHLLWVICYESYEMKINLNKFSSSCPWSWLFAKPLFWKRSLSSYWPLFFSCLALVRGWYWASLDSIRLRLNGQAQISMSFTLSKKEEKSSGKILLIMKWQSLTRYVLMGNGIFKKNWNCRKKNNSKIRLWKVFKTCLSFSNLFPE